MRTWSVEGERKLPFEETFGVAYFGGIWGMNLCDAVLNFKFIDFIDLMWEKFHKQFLFFFYETFFIEDFSKILFQLISDLTTYYCKQLHKSLHRYCNINNHPLFYQIFCVCKNYLAELISNLIKHLNSIL